MIILIVLALCVVAGCILAENYETEVVGVIMFVLGGVLLAIALVALPFNRMAYADEVNQINALRQTLADARSNGRPLENAAIQAKVAEANEWIASVKYWNGTAFDIWWPDSIEKMKPVR